MSIMPLRTLPKLADEAATRLQAELERLGASPALEPFIAKAGDTRDQLYVPYGNEPRELTEEDIEVLARSIVERTKTPTFFRLQLPAGLAFAERRETRSVSCRYLEMYDIPWDMWRVQLDVLFDDGAQPP